MDDLIGRAADRDRLWERLDESSVRLQGPRRIGKSTLLRAMAHDPAPGWFGFYTTVEGENDEDQVLRRVLTELGAVAPPTPLTTRLRRLAADTEELSVLGVSGRRRAPQADAQTPATALETLLRDILDALGPTARIVLMLDEVPYWLEAMEARKGGAGSARNMLSRLKGLRERPHFIDRLRIVMTGSVGFRMAIHRFGVEEALRDTVTYELGPLAEPDGARLFERAAPAIEVEPEAARDAAHLAGGNPHWIKRLASHAEGDPLNAQAVARAGDELSAGAQRDELRDEGHGHFEKRYGREERPAARAIFGAACHADEGATRSELLGAALAAVRGLARVDAEELIERLVDDYSLQERHGRFVVRNPLLLRWWRHGDGRR